jgi:hypothetical protein
MKYLSLLFLLLTSSCTIYTGMRGGYYPSTSISSQPNIIYTDSYRPWRFWTYRPYWGSYRPNYLGNVYQNNTNYIPPTRNTIQTNIYINGTNTGVYGGGRNNSGRTGGRSGPSGGRRK